MLVDFRAQGLGLSGPAKDTSWVVLEVLARIPSILGGLAPGCGRWRVARGSKGCVCTGGRILAVSLEEHL